MTYLLWANPVRRGLRNFYISVSGLIPFSSSPGHNLFINMWNKSAFSPGLWLWDTSLLDYLLFGLKFCLRFMMWILYPHIILTNIHKWMCLSSLFLMDSKRLENHNVYLICFSLSNWTRYLSFVVLLMRLTGLEFLEYRGITSLNQQDQWRGEYGRCFDCKWTKL